MSRNLERALEALDVGNQGTDEAAYGYDDPDHCARCLGERPVDGDLCPGCRAFLLGDSDDDPSERPPSTYEALRGSFQREVDEEMRRVSRAIINNTLYGNPGGPPTESRLTGLAAIVENEDRPTWLNPPPIPTFLRLLLHPPEPGPWFGIIGRAIPDPITSELLEPDRMLTQLRCAMFDTAQRRHVEELRALGWTGAYAHRRERRARMLGDTVTHWVLTTIAVPLDGR